MKADQFIDFYMLKVCKKDDIFKTKCALYDSIENFTKISRFLAKKRPKLPILRVFTGSEEVKN